MIVRFKNIRIRVWPNRRGLYPTWEFRWVDCHGNPHRVCRSSKAKVIEEARQVAEALSRPYLQLPEIDAPEAAGVYLLTDGELFRFGRSKNIKKRVSEQIAYFPRKLRVVKVWISDSESSIAAEGIVLSILQGFRVNGDWFDLPHAVRASIFGTFT